MATLENTAAGTGATDFSFGFTATAGRALLVFLAARNTGAASLTAPTGWTQLAYNRANNPVGFQDAIVVYGKTAVGTETDFDAGTGTWPTTSGHRHFVQEWSGLSISDLVLPTGSETRVGSGTAMTGSEAVVTGTATVIGFFAQSQDNTKTFTEGAGWTMAQKSSGGLSFHPQCAIVYDEATDESVTPAVTSNRTNGWRCLTLVFGEDVEEPEPEPDTEPEPGIWIDFDEDGFTGGTELSEEEGRLARRMPEGATPSGIDDNVTEWVLGSQHPVTGRRPGSPDHIGQPSPESYTFYLKNTDGRFSPDNTASPYYPKFKPGLPVWGGVNADGTLSGAGQTVVGFMAGYISKIAVVPTPGPDHAPVVEVIVDGPMAYWRRRRARVEFAEGRTYAEYREAILDSIGEPSGRRALGYEEDVLAFSGNATNKRGRAAPVTGTRSDFVEAVIPDFRLPETRTDPVALLESLNLATGARHFIQPADSKEEWYFYTTVPRFHNLTEEADGAFDGLDVVEIAGYGASDDSVMNVQEVTFTQVTATATPVRVWAYGDVPFALTSGANKVIVADLGDFVVDPTLDIASSGSAVTSQMTHYGTGAVIVLGSAGTSQVTSLTISGRRIRRDSSQTIEARAAGVTTAKERLAPTISTEYLQSQGLAEGRAEFTPWKFARHLARSGGLGSQSVRFVRDFSIVLARRLYDVVTLTVGQLSITDKRHEITGISFSVSTAATADISDWSFTFDLQETPNQVALDLLIFDVSLFGGTDVFAP